MCFILLPFIVIACSSQSKNVNQTDEVEKSGFIQPKPNIYTYTYRGQSKHWSAIVEQKVNIKKNEYEENRKITLTYKGPNLQSVGKVNSSFEGTNWSMADTEDVLLNKSITLQGGSGEKGTGPALPTKENSITASVKWNGKTEKFDLKQQ